LILFYNFRPRLDNGVQRKDLHPAEYALRHRKRGGFGLFGGVVLFWRMPIDALMIVFYVIRIQWGY
jgi:hypothetical protein